MSVNMSGTTNGNGNGNGRSSAPRASRAAKSFIGSLYTKRTTSSFLKKLWSDHHGSCSICTDEYDVNVMVNILPCGHIFHGTCIVAWLIRRNTCPLCRRKLYRDPPIRKPQPRRQPQPHQWLMPPISHSEAVLIFRRSFTFTAG